MLEINYNKGKEPNSDFFFKVNSFNIEKRGKNLIFNFNKNTEVYPLKDINFINFKEDK